MIVYFNIMFHTVLQALSHRLAGLIDLVVCNPPYVPTVDTEVSCPNDALTRSWAGGCRGRVVIDAIVPNVSRLLTKGGLFYLLLVHENDIPNVCAQFGSLFAESAVIMKRQCGRELLYVVRFRK